MSARSVESLGQRVLDLVFGKRAGPSDPEFARAAAPPPPITLFFQVAEMISWSGVLIGWLWRMGWLPFVESKLDSWWPIALLGFLAVLKLAWEQVLGHYERRAKARMIPTP